MAPEEFYTPRAVMVLSTFCYLLSVLGLLANLSVLILFFKVFRFRRFQSVLWVNLCLALTVQSLGLFYFTLGNHFLVFSGNSSACRFRYTVPTAVDLVCLHCYIVLFMERMMGIHLPIFHSVTVKIDVIMILCSWIFGLGFVLSIFLEILPYYSPSQCLTPFIDQAPQESVSIFTFCLACLLMVLGTTSLLLTTPENVSKLDQMRLQFEIKGARLVVTMGVAFLILWSPKQVVAFLYWTNGIDVLTFQVCSVLTGVILRIDVLVCFLALLTVPDFRLSLVTLLKCWPLAPIRRKVVSHEHYIDTIQRMYTQEVFSSVEGINTVPKQSAVVVKAISTKALSKCELSPRDEYHEESSRSDSEENSTPV